MIDLDQETPLSLREACHVGFVRRNGRDLNFSTIWRWAIVGVRSDTGQRIRLETVRLPSGLKTTREALKRFIVRLNGKPAAPPQTALQRQKAALRADNDLAEHGW